MIKIFLSFLVTAWPIFGHRVTNFGHGVTKMTLVTKPPAHLQSFTKSRLRLRKRISSFDVFCRIVALLDVDVQIQKRIRRIANATQIENDRSRVSPPKLTFWNFLTLSHHRCCPLQICWFESHFKTWKKIRKERLFFEKLTVSGKMANLLSKWIKPKMAERSEAKNAKRSFASKISQILNFDAKLRFAFSASLRSAIFCQIYVDNKIVALPAQVKSQPSFFSNFQNLTWIHFSDAKHFSWTKRFWSVFAFVSVDHVISRRKLVAHSNSNLHFVARQINVAAVNENVNGFVRRKTATIWRYFRRSNDRPTASFF